MMMVMMVMMVMVIPLIIIRAFLYDVPGMRIPINEMSKKENVVEIEKKVEVGHFQVHRKTIWEVKFIACQACYTRDQKGYRYSSIYLYSLYSVFFNILTFQTH